MSKLKNTLVDLCDDSMSPFYEVYLFGSALNSGSPTDVDLLLVYEGEATLRISEAKAKLNDGLESRIGLTGHFVTLSRNEMAQTRFLCYVDYVRIK